MDKKYTEEDYCDIYSKKLCDNCGKCLEDAGIDIRAIKIEDIAKDLEENKVLEEELKAEFENLRLENEDNEEDYMEDESIDLDSYVDEPLENEEYEDAFEHIEYLEDLDISDEDSLDEMTDELFPGVRVLKKKK